MQTKTESYIRDCLAKLGRPWRPDLIAAFAAAGRQYADAEAFRCMGKSITFTELDARSRDVAACLLGECGLSQGDRIAIQLPNLLQYPVVAWGALRAGLVVVNTNPLYTQRELAYQLNDSGARALVCLREGLDATADVLAETGVEVVVATSPVELPDRQPLPAGAPPGWLSLPDAMAIGRERELPEIATSLDDIALLQYTGGTTGAPKGAVLSHGNVLAAALMSKLAFGGELTHRDVGIAPMPLYHIYGFVVNLVAGYLHGGLSILIPDPRDADGLIAVMRAQPFTAFAGVNTLFSSLMQHADFDSVDFSKLDRTISGGAATVKETAEKWQRRTGCPIYEGYGLSETAAMATVNTLESRQLGTIGPAMPGTELRVVDAEGETLPAGEAGELLIRGPQVMQGYWQRDAATAEVIDAEGWLRTGDVALIQPDGHVRIVDRLKDMVLVSGFNVYPNEVESVVYGHPGVLECAAVGVPDDKTGEAVKLFVAPRGAGSSAEEIRAFCRRELAAYKVPKYVEFRDELPKTPVGKILRRELRR